MTSTFLSQIAGIVLSLSFSYIPGLKDQYAKLDSTGKSCVMALVIIVVACGIYAGACWGLLDQVTCDRGGAIGLAQAVIGALIANQAMYLISRSVNINGE
jgi:hypothetical protein